MTPLAGLLLVDLALLALAPAAAMIARRPQAHLIVYGATLALSALGLALASAHFLARAQPLSLVLPIGLPWLGAHFRLDALSAFFVALANLGAGAASVYALGYGRHESAPERVLPFYPAFLAGMGLVPLADDAYTFLICWEAMSLASWALVMAHHKRPENARAGYVYIVMAAFGGFALLLAFGLLAGGAGSYAFDAMRAHPPGALVAAFALALALIGAGSKAGLAPLHVWLPLAHPAAPSHVSALMSGVMTKIAVYGFVRIAFDLLGPPDWRWSVPIMALGAATALLGVLSANMEADLKRLLAFSTVENIGLVFLALGLALAFKADDLSRASALAMTAAMLHALNHMLFKSLLFFAAGAVLTATGTRDLNRLGGLFDRMRWTSLSALVGCAAIAGAAAAQRLRLGMADAASGAARPRLSAMDAEADDAGDGRLRRAGRRARRGRLLARLRRRLSLPPAHARGRAGSRRRRGLALRHGGSRARLPARRHIPRRDDRRAKAGRRGDGRGGDAAASQDRLGLDRAHRGIPLVLQRPAGARVLPHHRLPDGVRDPPLRVLGVAPRARLGLRLSPIRPGDAI